MERERAREREGGKKKKRKRYVVKVCNVQRVRHSLNLNPRVTGNRGINAKLIYLIQTLSLAGTAKSPVGYPRLMDPSIGTIIPCMYFFACDV